MALLSDVASGAATGSAAGPWGAAAGAGIALLPSLYKGISGIFQKRKANKINPNDPGYVMNNGVIDNARVLADRAGNYSMPGYSQAVGQIGTAGATGFANGVQGASSGGDVLDLATKIAYGQSQQLNQLATQNAQGADSALMQSLGANAQAGQEYQNKNAYDRDMYQQKLREKAALTQSANENVYGALDQAATVGTALLNPKAVASTGQQLTPQQLAAQQAYYKMLQGGI